MSQEVKEPTTTTPPAAPPVVPPAAPPAPEPESITFDTKTLQARLDRHARSVLKDAGFDSPEAAKAARSRLEEMTKADEERKLAEMSEIDRLKKQLSDKDAAETSARVALETERFNSRLERVCFAKGAKNVAYAQFLVTQARAEKPGEDVDVEALLETAMKDASTKAALGIPTALPVVSTPAHTSPQGTGSAPPTPPPAGAGTPPKSVKDMDPAQWRAWKAANNIPV